MNNFETFYGICVIDIDDSFRIKSISKRLDELFLNDKNSVKHKSVNKLLSCSKELKLAITSSRIGTQFSMPITLKSQTCEELKFYIHGRCEQDSNSPRRIITLSFFDYLPCNTSSLYEDCDHSLISSLFSLIDNTDFEKTIRQIFQIAADYFELDYMRIDTFLKQNFGERICTFFTFNRTTRHFMKEIIKPNKSHSLFFSFDSLKELPRMFIYTNELNHTNPFFIKYHNQYKINSIVSYFSVNSESNYYLVSFLREKNASFTTYELNTLEKFTSLICVFFDFQHKTSQFNQKINELLSKDNTTDTYVFESFLKLSSDVISKKKEGQFAFMSFDINHFDYIITHCSEGESANLLCELVGRFKDLSRSILISRLYGDNFMAMFQIKSKDDLHAKLTFLVNDFDNKMETLYPNTDISLSIGVYISNASEKNIKKCTENASYVHKAHKKNVKNSISYFTQAAELERQDEEEISSSFKSSLLKGEYKLYLQPKYNLLTQKIIGAEALSRLTLHSGIVLPPYRFIPILEQTGHLPQLDLFIFSEVAKTLRRWIDSNYKVFPISINFSKQHILSPSFVNSLVTIATEHNVPLSYFDIEMTETTLAANQDYMRECIEELVSRGFKVSIDDFGTGYSSLNMLLSTKVNTVKIDKAFVNEIGISEQKSGYLTRVIDLINFAGKNVIVEGVETPIQASFLLNNNITNIQGYYISKPLPLDDFEKSFVITK